MRKISACLRARLRLPWLLWPDTKILYETKHRTLKPLH